MRRFWGTCALVACALGCTGDPVASASGADSGATEADTGAGSDGAADASADDTSAGDTSAGDTSAGDTSAGDTSASDSSKADSTTMGDASFDGGVSPCPTPPTGSKPMVYVPAMKYCIDATEITNAEYNRFLAESKKPAFPARLKFCESRTAYGSLRFSTTYPATNVEWCHAYQYCAWAGKRLCGKHKTLGGGHLAESDGTTPTVSQWTYACKGGDPGTTYPYGATFDATKCAIGLTSAEPTTEAKYAGCTGGLAGLTHMSGNAAEWEDACNDSDAPNATSSCRTRGGWYSLTDAPTLQCETTHSHAITGAKPEIGFRCCADVP